MPELNKNSRGHKERRETKKKIKANELEINALSTEETLRALQESMNHEIGSDEHKACLETLEKITSTQNSKFERTKERNKLIISIGGLITSLGSLVLVLWFNLTGHTMSSTKDANGILGKIMKQ